MLDQQTKQQIKQSFPEIKPQIQQRFPDLQEQDLSQAQSDPDLLVRTIAKRSGQDESQVEQQFVQLVQMSGR